MLKQCGVCNKEFEPCNECNSTGYAWRKTVCCIEHSIPFLAILEYKRGQKTKDDAMNILKDYTNIDYNETVKPIFDEIMYVPIAESNDDDEIEEPVLKVRNKKK